MIMNRIKARLGLVGIVVLTIVPVLIWVGMRPLDSRFAGFAATVTSLGEITALLGMSLFSLNLVLSARFKFMEDYFGGLDKSYIFHHLIGGLTFVFLLFHPLVLSLKYLQISANSAAMFLLPGASWDTNFGIFALFSMMLLLVFTFYIKLPYQNWKLTHKFLGLAFAFGLFHMFLITSDVSGSAILRLYMFTLAGLGVMSLVYRVVLVGILVEKLDYVIEDVKELGDEVVEISLKAANKKMKFSPGQFVFINFMHEGVGKEVHPFSICSSPEEEILRLGIKSSGDYTSRMKILKKGVPAKIEGPYGRFSHRWLASNKQVWIAGGIGVTPFLSMARNLKEADYEIDMYYCVRNEAEAVFMDELMVLSHDNKNFRVIPCFSEKEGRISAQKIDESSHVKKDGKMVLICGPLPMMKSLKEQFVAMGVKKRMIRMEEFKLL